MPKTAVTQTRPSSASKPSGSQGASGGRVRNRRGEGGRLRDELIAAARRILKTASSGAQLSIRSVTKEAGVTPQSFYSHFKDLDEFIYAVFVEEFDDFTQVLRDAGSGATNRKEAIRSICQAYGRFALDRPARYRVLMGIPGQKHESWSPEALPGTPVIELMATALAAARSQDPKDPDVDRATIGLWANLHGLLSLRVNKPSYPWPPLDQLIDEAVNRSLVKL